MSMPPIPQTDTTDASPSAGRSHARARHASTLRDANRLPRQTPSKGSGSQEEVIAEYAGSIAVGTTHASPLSRQEQGRSAQQQCAGAGLGPTEVALRSGSDADEVVELLSVGAAAMDLFGQATEQGHVIQARGRLLDVYASHTGESAGDIDDVDGTATGTFDLASLRHGSAPFLPIRTVAGAARTCFPSSRPDPVPRDRDSTWRP